MSNFKNFAILFSLMLLLTTPVRAETRVLPEDVIVCPYHEIQGAPNRTELSDCESSTIWAIDPQNREIWVFAKLSITQERLTQAEPLGLFVSAKASSEAYLNGEYLGNNGLPGSNKYAETPGVMDSG